MAKKRSSSVINVLIAGDAKKFKKALGNAGSSLADFSKKVASVGATAGVALAGLGAKATMLAVDFEEGLSKAQQIFGDASASIEASAKGAATAVGLSQAEFLDAASSFGVFGKAAGLTGDDLSGFADEMVTVAADVASFNNLRPEEALEKLQAGLRGSNEPLQSIGILINAAAVEAKALEMGLADANGEISEGSKIMARQALILEELGKQGALGDFERTSGGLANQMRILKARFKNVAIEIGKKLIPIAMKVSKVIGKLAGFGQKLVDIFGKKGAKGVFQELGKQVAKVGKKLINIVKQWAPKIGKALLKLGKKFIKWIIDVAPKALKKLQELGAAFINWIVPLIPGILQKLGEWAAAIWDWLAHTAAPKAAEKIGEWAAAFLDWIGPVIGDLIKNLPKIVATIVKWLAEEAIPAIVKVAGKLAEKLVPALLRFGGEVLEGLGGAFADIGAAIGDGASALADLFYEKAIEPVINFFAELGGDIGRVFVNMGSYAKDQATAFGEGIKEAVMAPINFIGGLVSTALDVVVETFKTVYNTLVELWNDTLGGFGFTVPDWVKYTGVGALIAGKEFKIPELTPLATGGIVTSPTAALIGEAGPEAVIPLSKMGAMGGNITINMAPGASGEDVVHALQNYMREEGNLQLATTNTVRR
tara:strand:- start:6001 stop:7953 length:1953 start_codon:yes stop_codon:yes gene_type:complete